VRDLAAKYKKDPRIIEAIVYSPLKFTKRVIEDNNDNRAVRIRYFGVFTQKPIFNKTTRMEKLLEDLRKDMDVTTLVAISILNFPVSNSESVKKIIDAAEESGDYAKIRMIWNALQEYNK
jgi:hypothetical protein